MVRSTKIASLSNLPCFFFKRFQGVFACNVLTSLLFISTFESQCSGITMIDSVYVSTDRPATRNVCSKNGVAYGWREGWIAPLFIVTCPSPVLSYSANVKNCKTLNLKKYMYTLKPGMT